MSSLSYKVDGADNIIAVMKEIGGEKGRKYALKIVVPGAKAIRTAIKAEAPVGKIARPQQGDKPGNLRNSVRYKASRVKTGALGYIIGPFGKGSAHRHLVISGHNIKGGGGRTRPNPFVKRGRERSEAAAIQAVFEAAKDNFKDLGHE